MSAQKAKNYEELIIHNLKMINSILESDYLGKKGYKFLNAAAGADTNGYAGFITLEPTVFTTLTSNINFGATAVNTITFPTGVEIPCRISEVEISSGSVLLINA